MQIGIWGDSITYGACDSEALGWVGRLRKSLSTSDEAAVYNFGICGDTTEDLLKRFSIEAAAIEPEIVIFAIGINDSKFPQDKTISLISLDEFKQNMKKLIQQARAHTTEVYLVGATKVDDESARLSGTRFLNDVIQPYNVALREIAEIEKLTFINVFETLDSVTDLADGLHPNAQGYEKMYREITSSLRL
jgi:lysophospholipase L1-like esterase